jgi:hypothetical protein
MALILDDITDIDLAGLADNYILKYDSGTGTWLVEEDTAAGTGTWGFITGTIGNQGDLQAELDAKTDTGHAHAASDITSGTLADARVASSNVTQHEGDITHDSLGGVDAGQHIDWSVTGAEQVHADRYSSGSGGATNTVAGGTGITNTGDNVNAVLEPTYGATADTIAEGNDTRIVNSAVHATGDGSDHADVAANTLKVTNANHTGEVTGDTALTITANAVTLAKMAKGTPGGIIAYDTTTGDAVDIGVGFQDQVVTSNASGVPSWEDQTGGGGSAITVEDDGTPLTTDVTLLNFAGAVVVTEPSTDEITVTVTPGSAPVASVFGRVDAVVAVAGDYTASEVTNVPAGDIAAVTVQGAIDELDTDKAAVSHTQVYTTVDGVPTDTFLGRDTAGTGATEAMSLSTARNLLNVEDGSVAAGTSGDAYATSHEADPTAHTATEIVNTPAGDIIATTVQAAIDELDTEKSATGHAHTLSDITDSGTAAAKAFGVTIGDLVELENVGGNPGMPAVDGSQLTGIDVGTPITVIDDIGGELTTALNQLTFDGAGVVATEPGTEGEILVTIAGSSPGVIDITDGTTTVTSADKLTVDSDAFAIVDQTGNDALLNPKFNTTAGSIAEGDHTHDTLANVGQNVILGRDTAGSGPSEELTPAEARTLLNVGDGADVGGPAGGTADGDIAVFDDTTGKLIRLGTVTETNVVDNNTHRGMTDDNPHGVDLANLGTG